jgi:hypothetical protein
MKTYKKIMAEGLILAGLLGMFGCTDSRNTKLEYRYKLNYDEVLNKSSKVEDYLNKQGFIVETKKYEFSTNTGYMSYKNDGTTFYMTIELGGDDNRDVLVYIKSTDKKFDYTNLEKKVYEIMTEKTK